MKSILISEDERGFDGGDEPPVDVEPHVGTIFHAGDESHHYENRQRCFRSSVPESSASTIKSAILINDCLPDNFLLEYP